MIVVIFVRVALYFAKFTTLRKLMVKQASSNRDNAARAHVVARSVTVAAGFVPKATCMTQALSGQAILSWFGVPTELVIGAAAATRPSGTQDTDFHAWLIWDDTVILGGEELKHQKFATLSRMSSLKI